MPERICEICKVAFVSKMETTRFCSARCNRKMRWQTKKVQQTEYHKTWVAKNRRRMIAHQIRYNHDEMRRYPWRSMVRSTRKRAAKEGIPHALDFAWAEKRWTGRCEITGIPFALPEERYGRKNRNLFPSIDKIDPSRGYMPDNCRFVLFAVNVFKGDSTDEQMFEIANAISVSPVRIRHTPGTSLL